MIKLANKGLVLLFILSLSSFFSNGLSAQMEQVGLAERVQFSSTIIEGQVVDSYSFWDEGQSNIYTAYQIEVSKSFKGSQEETVEVIIPGGTVGLQAQKVSHVLSLNVGETALVMLRDIIEPAVGTADLSRFQSVAGPQSAIVYDEVEGILRGAFETFNTSKSLYDQIESLTSQSYLELSPYSFEESAQAIQKVVAITSFTPSTVNAGDESLLTISGSGFGATQGTVYFSNADDGGVTFVPALDTEVQSWSDTQVTVYVPEGAGTGTIAVETDGGGSFFTSAASLTVDYALINVISDAVSSGTFVAYPSRHANQNALGGYTWQMFTDFDADADANAAFIRSLDTWRCRSGVNWTIGSVSATDAVADDGINIVRFDNGAELPMGVLGRCTSRFSGCFVGGGTSLDWYVYELDIAFDDGTTWHYDRTETPFADYDFESVSAHELGHGYQQGHVIDTDDIMHYSIANGSYMREPSANNLAGTGAVQTFSTTTTACGESSATDFSCPSTSIVINEVDVDQVSTDSEEFVELFGPASTSLDGMVLVIFDGSSNESYGAYDLTGQSTDANGYFVIGGASVPNVDLTAWTTNALQQGADAVALYYGDVASWVSGSIITETNLIDALVYDSDDPDDAELLVLLNPGQAQINEDENNNKTTESMSRVPDGGVARNTDNYVLQLPTPGAANSIAGCSPDADPPVLLDGCGTEDASGASYGDGWQTGDGNGTEFGTWTVTTTSGDGGQNGHFIGDPAGNGDGDTNSDGDIGNPSWAMYANSSQTASGVLPFARTMQSGSTFKIDMDNGGIANGGSVGFGIQNASSENLWEFRFIGGQANYEVDDNSGVSSTTLGFTDEGLTIEISMTSSTSFDIVVTQLDGAVQWTGTSTLKSPGGGQIPAQLRVFNFNAGGGGSANAYFNNLEVCHPCPADISVACADFENTTITGAPMVTDVCDPSPTLTFSDVIGACASQDFTVTRTFTGQDASANTATCTQTLTVTDNVAPTATCQNINVALSGGAATILPADVDDGSMDGCSSVSLSLDNDTFDCTDIPSSPVTVTLTVTDDCGNQNTCTSDVTITSAAITAVTDGGNQSACQSPGNTYTNDVTVTYLNAPASGTLDVNGQSFAITASPQTVTLTGLTADGAPLDVTAQFSDDTNCPFTANALFTAPAPCIPTTTIVINEVDADQPGVDGDEFVELYGPASSSLDGMILVFYNGGSTDASYAAYDLDGYSLDANGFFVIGAASVPNVDYTPTGWTTNEIQNGADAIALYFGSDPDFPNGTGVTTTNIIDAIVYDTDDTDDLELLALLNASQPQVDEDGFTSSEIDSNSRVPDGGDQQDTDTYVQQIPTPGVTNVLPAGCSPDATAPVLTDACDIEDTDGASYNDGWASGDGDASLFGTWTLTTTNGVPAEAGFFIGSSIANGDGDGNADGDINIGGEAFGLYANNSQTSSAVLPFDEPLALGDRLSVDMDNGNVDAFGVVGVGIQNSSGENLWEFFFRGGESDYEINADGGSTFTGLAFTDEGLRVEIEITGTNTLDYTVSRIDGGGSISGSSTTIAQTGGQVPFQVRVFNFNSGSGSDKDAYFNRLELCHACPSDITVSCTDFDNINITGSPMVSDVCDIAPDLTWGDVVLSCSGIDFEILRTFTATDGSGNMTACAQTVSVTGASGCSIAPCNDDCTEAVSLTLGELGIPGWTQHPLGQSESLAGCSGTDADDDIWFEFVANTSNDVIFARDPSGASGYDPVIEVFDACGGTSLGCFNFYPAGEIERALPGGLVKGNTYKFRVYDAATGASSSTLVDVQVQTYLDGGVRPIYCDYLDYALNNFIIAEDDYYGELYTNPNVLVNRYAFRFSDALTGDTVAIDVRPDFLSWVILGQVDGIELNEVYDVSVAHRIRMSANGAISEYWSGWGENVCQIGTGGLIPIKLRTNYCPTPAPVYLEELVKAEGYEGADLYEFHFDGGGETFVKYKPGNYQIPLHTVGTLEDGLKYGTTYDVKVRARVEGLWTPEGDVCQVTMAASPQTTQLNPTLSCGGSYEVGVNPSDKIRALPVPGTYRYQFLFTPTGGGTSYFRQNSSSILPLDNNVNFLTPGDWDVQVRLLAGGMTGAWGPACTITIVASTTIEQGEDDLSMTNEVKLLRGESAGQMSIYPNPNQGEEFVIELESKEVLLGEAWIEVMDMTGREVYSQQAVLDGKQANLKVRPDDALGSGVYTITLRIGEERFVELLVVE